MEKLSNFLSLNKRDFIKGLFMAVGGAAIGLIYSTIQAGSLTFDWPTIGKAALTAAISYLMKNLFTNSQDQLGKKDPVKE
jgi:hypothetical protein